MTFNYHYHIKEDVLFIQSKKKRSKQGKINLSSNELLHEKSFELNKRIMKSVVEKSCINSYVYFPQFIESYAEKEGINPNNVLLSSGSDESIRIILDALAEKSGNVIIQYPEYENYFSYADLKKINVKKIKIDRTGSMTEDGNLNTILSKANPSIFIISNPNGFTGKAKSIKELKTLAETAWQNNHIMIIDEAYAAFTSLNHRELLEKYDNLIIIRSFSKKYGTAGLRLAAILSSEKIINYLKKWNMPNSISSIAYNFLIEIYKVSSYYNDIFRDIHMSKNIIGRELEKILKINVTSNTDTNFILLNFKKKYLAENFCAYLADNNVIVRDLSHIKNFEGVVRMTVGSVNYMEKVLSIIKNYHLNEGLYE
ncbi:histidinol-phosphate aminotransferase family protein [Staphylococcus gallinarum]|uniref:Histidinol-phosphate aminotransferase n=1 Tax=Staphylococcus gallinarum TaxID=1293 RepID=A0A0D0RL34_STAGA|nr:aminotransferase class I/II-fold pyridoxal phosphate-dependent enzyme [Staphylococcus gallinarum]KIR10617.1 hypothetical protein SH09_12055 [Staphylococcus gallinarum]RTX83018.1 histidinol-phosphate aminotransferase family protein [Staphylococcus gallinarum]GEQ06561.1 histidinol-phosphate aminotransferase [Staphylococcus gallinarum]SUQ38632.1 Histidinol-phosphate aminotransferase [Staphylococcus gallinarum]